MTSSSVAERPPRPAMVAVAFWLQLGAVFFLLSAAALFLTHAIHYDGVISRVAEMVPSADPVEVSDERAFNISTALTVGLPALLLAAWLGATATPVRRGSNVARILVFVAGGAQLLIGVLPGCCGGALFLPLLASSDPYVEEPYVDDPTLPDDAMWQDSQFMETLYSQTDPFGEILLPIGFTSALVAVVLTLAVVLLLALPPANGFFVPRTPAVPPAVAYGPPPGYPYPPGYPVICPDPSAHFRPAPPPPPPAPPAGL